MKTTLVLLLALSVLFATGAAALAAPESSAGDSSRWQHDADVDRSSLDAIVDAVRGGVDLFASLAE